MHDKMTDFWESFSAPKIHFMILHSEMVPFVLFPWTWTTILKIFKLCLRSSKMNNLSSSLYLHLELFLRAIWSWHSKGWTKLGLLAAEQSPNSCSILGLAATEPTVSLLQIWHPQGWLMPPWALTLQTPYNYKNSRFNKLAKFHWARSAGQVPDTKEAMQLQELWHACRNNGAEQAAGGDSANIHCRVKSTKKWSQRTESNRESYRSIEREPSEAKSPPPLFLQYLRLYYHLGSPLLCAVFAPSCYASHWNCVPVQDGNQQLCIY